MNLILSENSNLDAALVKQQEIREERGNDYGKQQKWSGDHLLLHDG